MPRSSLSTKSGLALSLSCVQNTSVLRPFSTHTCRTLLYSNSIHVEHCSALLLFYMQNTILLCHYQVEHYCHYSAYRALFCSHSALSLFHMQNTTVLCHYSAYTVEHYTDLSLIYMQKTVLLCHYSTLLCSVTVHHILQAEHYSVPILCSTIHLCHYSTRRTPLCFVTILDVEHYPAFSTILHAQQQSLWHIQM